MKAWERATIMANVHEEAQEEAPSMRVSHREAMTVSGDEIVIVNRFDLSMIPMSESGARILVRELQRSEALRVVRESKHRLAIVDDRATSEIEAALQLEPTPRATLAPGRSILVMSRWPRWNDVHYYLISYESDGDGVLV